MKRKSITGHMAVIMAAALMGSTLGACGNTADSGNTQSADNAAAQNETESQEFKAKLDTDKAVTLEIAGYMGNFEALDRVINDFNEYYPDVTITYEQNNAKELVEYIKNNQYVDIFMTNMTNLHDESQSSSYAADYCLDLSDTDINTQVIEPKLLEACSEDGKLLSIPLTRTMCGIVVNETLLKKEGVEIPQTYQELLDACKTLKEKGYTPIQASKYHANSDLILPMGMCTIANNSSLMDKVNGADGTAAGQLREAYEKLSELYTEGYIDAQLNAEYPDDNYDGAILKFFEGDVPFWVCTTECVSGMKKRESKSETFTANPFEYTFVNAPLGDNGVYIYEEPWYGFAVNKDSEDVDYAVEFMRFLATEDELNALASVKGMPSTAINGTDERFEQALNPAKVEAKYIYDGKLKIGATSAIADVGNELGNGEFSDVDSAMDKLADRIGQL